MTTRRPAERIRHAARALAGACAVAWIAGPALAVSRIESWREYEKTRDLGAELRLLGLIAIAVAVTLWFAIRLQRVLDRRRRHGARPPAAER